jgi:hypothetical protein
MDSPQITELDDGSVLIEEAALEAPAAESDHFANLALKLTPFQLNTLATELLDLIEKDEKAREARDKQQEEGIRRTGLGDDAPGGATFSGASKVVHPALAEGCVDFSARAMKELFPANGPVKTKIFGKDDRKQIERARAKRDYLNWQLTHQIVEYRDEKEVLLTQLPLGGSQYMKFWPDRAEGRIRCEFVPIDEVFLPYAAASFRTAPRFTHRQTLTEHTFEAREESGLYVELSAPVTTDTELTASGQATEKVEGKEASGYNEDGTRIVYETTVYYEIDGEHGWYVVHLDKNTNKVLGIYRNWAEGDTRKRKLEWWTEDKFIPWRGAQGIGLLHLIGSLVAASTGALRALLDSAHINNAPTAVKLKGTRSSGQNVQVDVTEIQEVEGPTGTDDIRKVIMAMPFNPPSTVLLQLLEWLTNQAKGVVATAEERIADAGNNMPVGTALALIEQGSQVFSSIHARLHATQKHALDIICRLNREYPDAESMARFGVAPEDFAENDDVDPVSDPNIFSESQRYAQLQAVMQLTQDQRVQYNVLEVHRRALDLMRVEYADEILPKPKEPITSDPVTENFAACAESYGLKADPSQDHVSHLQEHLRFLLDPMFGAGPALSGQQLQPILAHCQEHLLLVYLGISKTAAAIGAARTGNDAEQVMAQGAAFAGAQLAQQLPQLAQQLSQAAQVVQSKMPQPPVDPAVQKTFEAAMAEIERKKVVDKQSHDREMAKLNSNDQLEAAQMAQDAKLAEAKNFFDLQVASAREQAQRLADELNARVELMKNDADNQQHQQTEIIKNLQDNITQLRVNAEQVRNSAPEAPDFTPQVEALNSMLAKVEQAKSQDALLAVAEGIRGMMEQMAKPKRTRLEFDAAGKPVGTVQE